MWFLLQVLWLGSFFLFADSTARLVLATGSSPFVPPLAGLKTSTPGIFVYRTIEDMDALQRLGGPPQLPMGFTKAILAISP
jgi:NADPH-dependent 2,4-dienoyl-CoA reductase/sulfur reductase-like enzyme